MWINGAQQRTVQYEYNASLFCIITFNTGYPSDYQTPNLHGSMTRQQKKD
jgi:hypothetical protein